MQYRGHAQVITWLRKADAKLDSANLTVENITTAWTKIGEGIGLEWEAETFRVEGSGRIPS